ncbi:MAG TPA: hypothetical protein VJH22_05345 [Candidatus Nanoarchaeia archaeon]|nr:hypothetical protein [Candidatus Nanoarchaeia archaeon]
MLFSHNPDNKGQGLPTQEVGVTDQSFPFLERIARFWDFSGHFGGTLFRQEKRF